MRISKLSSSSSSATIAVLLLLLSIIMTSTIAFSFLNSRQLLSRRTSALVRQSRVRLLSSSINTNNDSTTTNTAAATSYPFQEIESKWQKYWSKNQTFKTPQRDLSKPKKYVLDMFHYPSGAGLHVGHPEGYTASDAMARYWRMKGYNVLHPMGWDSFGLPAEQFAIQTGAQPSSTTTDNISNFKRQLQMLGFSYDWDKEIATTDLDYIKWTQWIFLQLFNKGLAEQSSVAVNWCPKLGTVLANEEVINGLSERGDHPVERTPLRQWILKITNYADRLEEGLSSLNWPSGTLTAQQQWIGKSFGCQVDFDLDTKNKVSVFTTRVDTLMGVTYVVLAPEHPLVTTVTTDDQQEAVSNYVKETSSRSDLDRTSTKEKTGVFTGGYAQHPITSEQIPIWVGDYVLGSYGTGAVMAVPAHDQRDYEFASKYSLPKKWVIANDKQNTDKEEEQAMEVHGTTINSGEEFNGLKTPKAKKVIAKHLKQIGKGQEQVTYKLRDWVFSRQRYWGEPIPIYFPVLFPEGTDLQTVNPCLDDNHTIDYDQPIPVDESDLPIQLPLMEDFQPGTDPAGCLARAKDWRYFQKEDGKWYARETNTMPQWAGSCWYYLRFIDTKNTQEAFSKQADEDWMPVDLYVGGAEHAVLHLLYARFWHHVLFDLGYTKHPEPFKKLVHQGMILGTDGEKMSKSRGNVVNPDDIVDVHGADALRLYEMFMGPLEAVKPWQTSQVSGVVRFQNKLYKVVNAAAASSENVKMSDETTKLLHQTMKKVTEDIEAMSFNTAISAMMVFTNHLQSLIKDGGVSREAAEKLTLMISPFAPHIGEECWNLLGYETSLTYHPWVEYDEELCIDDTITIGVQVNGKVRGEISINKDAKQEEAMVEALKQAKVEAQLEGKETKKVIYVPGRILNIIAK